MGDQYREFWLEMKRLQDTLTEVYGKMGDMIDKYSKSSIVDRYFEITSFKKNDGEVYRLTDRVKGITEPYFRNKDFGGYGCTLSYALKESIFTIYSVKRLSDGVEFKIGDRVHYVYDHPYQYNTEDGYCGIQSFKVSGNHIYINDHPEVEKNRIAEWRHVPLKKVLFTTEDGVEIFDQKETRLWFVNYNTWDKDEITLSQYVGSLTAKYFFSKEKAEEYILLNKPVLSVNDVIEKLKCDLNFVDKSVFEKTLKQAAKEKIKINNERQH